MGLRENLQLALKNAMKTREADHLSTLRLINAAIKDREITLRGNGDNAAHVNETEITAILVRMVKQRHESARSYEEGGRLELAEKELAEIKVIEEFLPRQLNPDEIEIAITKAISETSATGIRDMGKVMSLLKDRYAGQMDFGSVGLTVKSQLS